MTGGELQSKIMKYLVKNYNATVINVVRASVAGIPDLIACINGEFYAFEVKTPNDRPSDLQLAQLARIGKSGGFGGIVRSTADVDTIIANKIRPQWDESAEIVEL